MRRWLRRFFSGSPIFGRITTAEGKSTYHRHHYERVGYGGAGWSLFECACGATEIDA